MIKKLLWKLKDNLPSNNNIFYMKQNWCYYFNKEKVLKFNNIIYKGFPNILWYGEEKGFNVIVMEILGPTL